MATIPQVPKQTGLAVDSNGNYVLPKDHKLPGWSVDALLEEGKIEAARAELQQLIAAGVDSGPGRPMNEEFFNELMARAKSRVRPANR